MLLYSTLNRQNFSGYLQRAKKLADDKVQRLRSADAEMSKSLQEANKSNQNSKRELMELKRQHAQELRKLRNEIGELKELNQEKDDEAEKQALTDFIVKNDENSLGQRTLLGLDYLATGLFAGIGVIVAGQAGMNVVGAPLVGWLAEDVFGYDEMIDPSADTSKATQNVATDQFRFWMKNLDRSLRQRNKLAQTISQARYRPPPHWRQSATPSSLSSTISCSPPPTNNTVTAKPVMDVCQICEDGVPWKDIERCDGCRRNRGPWCNAKPPAPYNVYCLSCERDSGNSQEDAESILALARTCRRTRCTTFADMLLSLAQMHHPEPGIV